jgi:hypothetical protein
MIPCLADCPAKRMPGRSGLNASATPDVVNQSWLDNKTAGELSPAVFLLSTLPLPSAFPVFLVPKLRFGNAHPRSFASPSQTPLSVYAVGQTQGSTQSAVIAKFPSRRLAPGSRAVIS